jgi:hypothetical protein
MSRRAMTADQDDCVMSRYPRTYEGDNRPRRKGDGAKLRKAIHRAENRLAEVAEKYPTVAADLRTKIRDMKVDLADYEHQQRNKGNPQPHYAPPGYFPAPKPLWERYVDSPRDKYADMAERRGIK